MLERQWKIATAEIKQEKREETKTLTEHFPLPSMSHTLLDLILTFCGRYNYYHNFNSKETSAQNV